MKDCTSALFIKVKDRFQLRQLLTGEFVLGPLLSPGEAKREGRCLPEQATIQATWKQIEVFFLRNQLLISGVSRILSGRVTGIVLTVLQDAFG